MANISGGGHILAGSGVDTSPLLFAGAPTVNVTYLGTAVVGSRLTDVTNGIEYICTATNGTSTVVWTKVGTQT